MGRPKQTTRQPKRRKRRKGKDALATKQLDAIVRKILLARDVNGAGASSCRRCGRIEGSVVLQVSHVLPKGRYPWLRFDLDNVILLCRACHCWWHENPVNSGEWFRENFPAQALNLQVKGRQAVPMKEAKVIAKEILLSNPAYKTKTPIVK